MSDASSRGWGDCGSPGSPTQQAYRRNNIVKTEIAGVAWYVHRQFEPILRHLLERYVVPTIGPLTMRADDWSYASRCIRNTGPGTSRPCVMSNHSWGLAVDVNATQNVQGGGDPDGQFPPDFGDRLSHLMIRWGGDFTSTKDPMHFEFVGTPDDADRIAATIEREGEEDMTPEEVRKIVKEAIREELRPLAVWIAGKENSVYRATDLGVTRLPNSAASPGGSAPNYTGTITLTPKT